jgi:hypothetical protein
LVQREQEIESLGLALQTLRSRVEGIEKLVQEARSKMQ